MAVTYEQATAMQKGYRILTHDPATHKSDSFFRSAASAEKRANEVYGAGNWTLEYVDIPFSPMHSSFEHVSAKNADGTPQRFRRNGKTKIWKTRPGHFRIPVKRGLYEYGYIDHDNAGEFNVSS